MFGELKKVSLREIWPHEASDFTPWLANNIEELGLAIGIELELIEREASVGDFSLDLLAKDLGSTKTVIIENQLTQTDHDHLGKLITYAAGFSASIIIWVSEVIREEHRQALDWLNQRTDSDTLFFGVVVEVFKIDDSKPAFNFKIAASPNEWQKSKTHSGSSLTVSTKGEKYRAYFQLLLDELREKYHFTGAKLGQPQNWYSFSSGISGITYGAVFSQGGKARTEVYIDLGDHEKNKQIFDLLKEEDAQIEKEIEENLCWERLDDKRASRLALYTNGNIEDSDAELEIVKNWHIEKLLKFKKYLDIRLKKYVKIVQ